MKKHILLPFVLGLGLLFFANSAKSQNFQIVASFGTTQNWAVPNAVLYEIDYYYPYHQIVHINRERRGRNLFFNVLLENRGQFVEVFFGRQAMILDVNYFYNYPLAQHICNSHCGYHGNFYRTHQVVAHNRVHRNNHIVYRSNRNYNSYASKSGAASRNVRSNYSSNSSRMDNSRNSSMRNSGSRNQMSRQANSRTVESSNRSNSNSRFDNSSKKPTSVRSNSNSRSSSTNKSSRTTTSANSRNRN
jgi:hypothetical protein